MRGEPLPKSFLKKKKGLEPPSFVFGLHCFVSHQTDEMGRREHFEKMLYECAAAGMRCGAPLKEASRIRQDPSKKESHVQISK